MYNHKIVNTVTGEETVEPLNKAESDIIEKNLAEALAEQAKEAEAAAKRQTALAKLEALGLDTDDLKALGL